jgi:2,4-diaminopentanoate dehydrogenase
MDDRAEPYRVVQWTTGNVGRRSVRAVAERDDLELVGCFAWSADKRGVDVGVLAGIDPLGVSATDDVDALLALRPDCVIYNPMWPDVDEMARILASGANMVSTAGFITGHALGEGRERLRAACAQGGSTLFGSGMNPGFANLIALVSAGICDRVDKITVLESVDSTGYDSPDTELLVGFARPIDDPDLADHTRRGTAVFGDAVHLMADALGVELDEVRFEAEYARTTHALDLGSWTIPADGVAGVAASWQGWAGGRCLIDLRVRWRKGRTLEPDWPVEHGYVVEIEGQPRVRTKVEITPPPDFQATTFADYMVLGMIITAMPAVDAIPAVCAAPPGIATYVDLPLVTARLG